MADTYLRASGVLQNRFGLDDHAALSKAEMDLTRSRLAELNDGKALSSTFERDHLKALHHHIFQDVYPWAGRMRDETFTQDGHDYSRINISKGGTQFLPDSRITMGLDEALKPLSDRLALTQGNAEAFADKAGQTLSD